MGDDSAVDALVAAGYMACMTRCAQKRWIGLTGVLVLIAGGWIGLDCAYRPRLTTGPMVQLLQPGGFTLVWSLHPDVDATIELTALDGVSAGRVELERKDGRHVAVVSGLLPRAEYRYAIRSRAFGRQVILGEAIVRTAPAPGSPFRFTAFGDTGDGGLDQFRVAARLLDDDPDLVIHTGDLIYDRGEAENYPGNFYRPYAELIARVPFYPSLGNHDYRNSEDPLLKGRPLLDNFILPANGPPGQEPEREYWFDFGNARFVALDSNRDLDFLLAAVAPWLDGVLASAGDRWKIVFFHEPPFTHGDKHDPAERMLQAVVPVLDRNRVHVVFCGHNHMYERTHPLRDGQMVAEGLGTVHIVTGAGGAGLYEEKPAAPPYMAAWYHERHSFTVVDVGPEQMRVRQINDLGAVVDSALIPKKSAK